MCRICLLPLTRKCEFFCYPLPLSVSRFQNELELIDVIWEFREAEGHASPTVEIPQFERLEVTYQEEARAVFLPDPVEVVARLVVRVIQIPASAFLFYEQHVGPEQIGESASAETLRHKELVMCDAATADAKNSEEVVVEALCLALLTRSFAPIVRKDAGAFSNFFPNGVIALIVLPLSKTKS